jgi:hypothetical protein
MKLSFGKNKASLRLVAIVENNPAARRRVSSILSEHTQQMMAIITARDPKVVRLCLKMLREYTIKRIDSVHHFSPEIKMYCKNVVIGRFRAHLNGFNTVIAMQDKAKKRLTSTKKGV